MIQKAVDQLVLYTNINKETAGYRLFKLIKEDRVKPVSDRSKRLAMMMFFLTRSAAIKRIRSGFDEIKRYVKPERMNAIKMLI